MEIAEVSPAEYSNYFPGQLVYNSPLFNLLNRQKCDSLHFLVFRDSKVRLGMILGEKEGVMRCPFSAPFGGFAYNRSQPALTYIQAVNALKDFLDGRQAVITPPPSFYAPDSVAKTIFALENIGAVSDTVLNYHCKLTPDTNAEELLHPDQKRNLRIAANAGLSFDILSAGNREDIIRVYDVIKRNREEKGYILSMSLDDVIKTLNVVEADLFLVTKEKLEVASALVYRVSPSIAQVIYWGNLEEFNPLHPMALLTTGILNYYKKTGLATVDAGPAGDFSELNSGLCSFKEHIGYTASVKRQYTIKS